VLKHVSHVNIWVHDQDESLAFYTEKLGFEVREDVTLDEFGGSPSVQRPSPTSA
jgi:catechol 2,3-dioxygenase-like lactoylglutathione lyase family enzyme